MVSAGVSSGLPNLHLKQKSKYKIEPPFGYGGNLSYQPSVESLRSGVDKDNRQEQHRDFITQLSHPASDTRISKIAPRNGRVPRVDPAQDFKPDPNLDIKPLDSMLKYQEGNIKITYKNPNSRDLTSSKNSKKINEVANSYKSNNLCVSFSFYLILEAIQKQLSLTCRNITQLMMTKKKQE